MIRLLMRDLTLAIRAGGGFGLALAFFLIVCVLVPFGVGPDRSSLAPIAPGILWLAALLAKLGNFVPGFKRAPRDPGKQQIFFGLFICRRVRR